MVWFHGVYVWNRRYLDTVEEWTKIGGTPIGLRSNGLEASLTGSEIVSMNVWGFLL